MKVRTRFAPSPTGYLHIGNARTALYSWLIARKYDGDFILRIEDTDAGRSTHEATEIIIDSMNWLNLEWNEGPYFQSKRLDRYNMIINEMINSGIAYKCYCSKERLDALRIDQIKQGKKPRYDGYCRYNKKFYLRNKSYSVRFANPQEGSIVFFDQVRGLIEFNNQELDDLIIRRTDGLPTYNFCVVIDDFDMKITHVIRGEDHINNTPRQINILKALNIPIPIYAHVSMIKGDDGRKLSKRNNTVSVMQYRDEGYLPEALLNYLACLGWSNGNQEIFSKEEMIKLFSLNAISKSASVFNVNKLMWYNRHYINSLPEKHVVKHLKWYMKKANIVTKHGPEISVLIKLLGKRYKTLKEIVNNCRYFYEDFDKFDVKSANKYLNIISYDLLEILCKKLSNIGDWKTESIHYVIKSTADELKLNMGQIGMPLRVAITGSDRSPSLEETIQAIGRSRSIKRIKKALLFIKESKRVNGK